MKNYTPDYEYKQVNTKDICVDTVYQRSLNKARVNQIVKEFNPYLLNPPKLSFRDGKYWVFDGMHTTAAVKSKNGGRDCKIECKVFYGLTELDECELFIAQNGISAPVALAAKLHAKYNSGDPEVTDFVKWTEKAGFVVAFDRATGQNRIVAIAKLYQTFKMFSDPLIYVDMLDVIRNAWHGAKGSLEGGIIYGVATFYKTYYGEFSKKRLINVLSSVSPLDIGREAKGYTISGKTSYARIILKLYNSRTTSSRLEDKL